MRQWSRERNRFLSNCLTVIFFSVASTAAIAQEESQPGIWDAAKNTVTGIVNNGKLDAYLAFHAYHNRSTYSKQRLKNLSEDTLGIGLGSTLVNEKGNEESLYVLINRDSRRSVQLSAGYAYQWLFPIPDTNLHAGAGLAAVIMRREDCANGWPFPALLPVFSFGTHELKLMGTYVPRVSLGRGKGDVVMFLLRGTL